MFSYKLKSYGSLAQDDRIWFMANGVMLDQDYEITFRQDMVLVVSESVHVALPSLLWEQCLWEQLL